MICLDMRCAARNGSSLKDKGWNSRGAMNCRPHGRPANFVLFLMEKHNLNQGVCMDRDNVKIENIFKTEDNEARKEAVLASLISLVEKDLEKGVRIQAIAHLHKK